MNQSMHFESPEKLWLLLLVPAALGLLVLGWRARRRARRRWAGQLFARLAPGYDPKREWVKTVLVLGGWAMLVLALARPQWGGEMVTLKRRGIDLMIAVDVSASMLAEDMRPNRLEHAKRAIADLVDRMEGDRIGLIAFAGDAETVCPLTLDRGMVRLLLESLDVNSVSLPGTNLAEALVRARTSFLAGEQKHKAAVVITDGESHQGDVLAQAREAKKTGLIIYTIGIGSTAGEPIPEHTETGTVAGFKKDKSGHVVNTRLDEATLVAVAQETGGKYFRGTPQGLELTAVADDLQQLEKKELEGGVADYAERFQWPLGIAVLLLMFELVIPSRRRRPAGQDVALTGMLCALLLTAGVPRQAATLNRDGTHAYEDKRYDEAVDRYTEALTGAPESAGISYNLGNALYRNERFTDAAAALARAAQSQDPDLRHRSLHNLGNTFFRSGNLKGALNAYQQALAAKPDDRDTKINYEKALRLQQQQEQEQKQNQQSGEKQNDQDEKDQGQQGNEEQKDQQQEQQRQQDEKPGEQQDQKEQPPKDAGADSLEVPEGEMGREEAMRILQALRDQEREQQKEKALKRLRTRRVEKDW